MTGARNLRERARLWPRERLAERLSAASYGTVLVLASLALIDTDEVSSGLGWELVTGVGVATWIAHLYAEAVGDHVRAGARLDRSEIRRAMADGIPILLVTVPPAVMLGLGRLEVLGPRLALWSAVIVALLQLVGVGALVGSSLTTRKRSWAYPAATAVIGLTVVALKVLLGH